MEYSSTFKPRLPGISVDFGSDDDDDDGDLDDDHGGDLGCGGGVVGVDRGAATRSSAATTIVRPAAAPAVNGDDLSPTTRRLHEAANALVDSREDTALERAEDAVASVVGAALWALRSSPSPWRRRNARAEEGEDGGGGGGGGVWPTASARRGGTDDDDDDDDDDDYDDDDDNDDDGAAGGGGGEQTAILDAAAAYMARMERLYAVDATTPADEDGNDGRGGREGGAGDVDGHGRAAAEEADRNDDRASGGNGGPYARRDDREDDVGGASRTTTAGTATEEFRNRSATESNSNDDGDGGLDRHRVDDVASRGDGIRDGGGSVGLRVRSAASVVAPPPSGSSSGAADANDHVSSDAPRSASSASSSPPDPVRDESRDESISFYIGVDDGFLASSSIHESDISVTASDETSHDDDHHHDNDDCGDDGDTIFDEETIGAEEEVMAEEGNDDDDGRNYDGNVPTELPPPSPPPPPPPPSPPPSPPQSEVIICADDPEDPGNDGDLDNEGDTEMSSSPRGTLDDAEEASTAVDVAIMATPTRSSDEADTRPSPDDEDLDDDGGSEMSSSPRGTRDDAEKESTAVDVAIMTTPTRLSDGADTRPSPDDEDLDDDGGLEMSSSPRGTCDDVEEDVTAVDVAIMTTPTRSSDGADTRPSPDDEDLDDDGGLETLSSPCGTRDDAEEASTAVDVAIMTTPTRSSDGADTRPSPDDEDLDDDGGSETSSSPRGTHDDDEEEEATTMTPTRSSARANTRSSPRYTDNSSVHDYVPTTLKKMMHRQESELMQLMSSVDAFSATPERIANLLVGQDEEDDDDDLELMVDVGDDGGSVCRGTFSAVKRRLMPDGDASDCNVDFDGTKMTSAKSRRRMEEPSSSSSSSSSSVDRGRSSSETQNESAISTPENHGSTPSAKFIIASLPSSLPQTPPVTTSECSAQRSEGGLVDDSMLPPPHLSIPEAPPSSSNSSQDKPAGAKATKAIGGTADETWRQQPNVVISREEKSLSSSTAPVVARRRGDIDFASESEKRHAVIDEDCLRAVTSADGDDVKNDDFVPDYMKQLFRDADSVLENALTSSLAMDGRGVADGDGTKFLEDDIIELRRSATFGNGISFLDDDIIEPRRSGTLVTAEGSHMPAAANWNDGERAEKARLAAAETAKHDGQDFFAAQLTIEREGTALKPDLTVVGLLAETERVEKEYGAVMNDTFDTDDTFNTAFCSLGAIERTVGDVYAAKVGDVNTYSTESQGFVNSQNPLGNIDADASSGSAVVPTDEDDSRGVENNSELREPTEIGKTASMNERSSKVMRCNLPRYRMKNGGKNGNSSALASALTEYEEIHKMDNCDVTKIVASLGDNDREAIATSSSINGSGHNGVSAPAESFKSSCLEQATEAGNSKGDADVIGVLTEHEESKMMDDCDVTTKISSLGDNDKDSISTSSSINEGDQRDVTEPAESLESSCRKDDPEDISKIAKSNNVATVVESREEKLSSASTAPFLARQREVSDFSTDSEKRLAVNDEDSLRAEAGADRDDVKNDDFVPDHMKQLFHNADSILENALASLLTMDESEADGDGTTFLDDDIIEPRRSATLATAKGAHLLTAAEGDETKPDHIQYSQDILLIDEDSRPSSAAKGKSNPDESMFNESMFMPNLSIDIANSPESENVISTAAEPMPAMSEDESEGSHGDEDDENFFPNPDHSMKTNSTAGANKLTTENERKSRASLEHPLRASSPSIDASHIAYGEGSTKETKQVAPDHSTSSLLRGNTSRVMRSLPCKTVATGLSVVARDAIASEISKPSSSTEVFAALKRCDQLSSSKQQQRGPRWSLPSTMKPAKKRSKAATPVTTAPAKGCGENIKSFPRTGPTPKSTPVVTHKSGPTPASQRSEVASAPFQTAKPPIREMRGKSSSFNVTTSGKENNKDKLIEKGKQTSERKHTADIASSRSMKQSLVSIARNRRQSESNMQAPSLGKNLKRAVDMSRLDRLARPRIRQPTPHLADPGPANNNTKKETRSEGPPSFLSRPTSSSYVVKSTYELEKEEMERIKPFKARKILGSSAEVKSRFQTATPRLAAAPSPSGESKSNLKPPAAARPPSNRSRDSVLYKATPTRERVSTFGESMQHYLNHGLRGSTPRPNKELTSTIKPPSFLHRHTSSHSTKAKSSEEIELDECKKQFRARTVDFGTGCNVQVSCHTPALQRKALQRERPRLLTTPSPFRLYTDMRAQCIRPPPPSTDDLELAKKFTALPLPSSSTRFFKASIDTAQIHYNVARQRRQTINVGECDHRFKAKPVPKTTYVVEGIKKTTPVLTQPSPPILSLFGRAEARKLFDHHQHEVRNADNAMKEMKELQRKEMEEEEIRRQRRIYADDGGFCFKARSISIEYV